MHFFAKKFAYIKKKLYLCSEFKKIFINIKNYNIMKSMLNEKVLIQMEIGLNENAESAYRVTTFFRYTHSVHVSEWYKSYKDALKLFNAIIKIEFAL